jgi:hypothetical protein
MRFCSPFEPTILPVLLVLSQVEGSLSKGRRCKACVRTRPQVYLSTSRTGRATRNAADAQEGHSKQNVSQTDRKFANMRQSPPRYALVHIVHIRRRPPPGQFFTHKNRLFLSKPSKIFQLFTLFFVKSALTFVSFIQTFVSFQTFSNVSNHPTPTFRPKSRVHS